MLLPAADRSARDTVTRTGLGSCGVRRSHFALAAPV